MHKKMSALAAALVAGMALAGSAHAQQQVVKVGFSYSSPSWSWYDVVSGINNGFMLDLMTAVGKDAGFQVTFSGATINDLPTLLANKSIDAISTIFTSARDPLGVAEFSIPIWTYGEALLINKRDGTDYRSLADLSGKTVSPGVFEVPLKSAGVPMNLGPAAGGTVDAIDLMRAGKMDVIMYSSATVAYIVNSRDYPDLMMAQNYVPSFLQPISIAVRKGDTVLLNKINTSLKKLMADGTVKTIWAKYHLDWTPPRN